MLTPPAFFIACQLDGKNDIVDIQYAFAKQFAGHMVLADDIHRIVTYLDANGFLWTERFTALQRYAAPQSMVLVHHHAQRSG